MDNRISYLLKVLEQIKKKKVLVVGDIILDEYLYGDVTKVSTGIRIPIIEKQNVIYRLGGAGNIAANIAGLSNCVSIIGKCGNDDSGKVVSELLEACGIKLFNLKSTKTILKQRIYVDKQQIARVDDNYVCSNDLELFETYLSSDKYDVIVVADYQYGLIDPYILTSCIKKAYLDKIPVLFTSRNVESFDIDGISALVLSEDEAKSFIEKKDGKIQIKENQQNNTDFFITLGNQGIYCKSNNKNLLMETAKLYPVNVSGAGDTVFAIISLLYGENVSIEDMMEIANLAGGLAVSNELTYIINPNELVDALFGIEVKRDYANKIVDITIAKNIVSSWKKEGKQVVFTNGCYDLLHLGHIHSFKLAKEKGDKLIVAVNSDASIKRIKGDNRPINTLEERVMTLSFLDMIDMLIVFDEDTAINVIKYIEPDLYVKGEEYRNKELVEAQYVAKVEYIPMVQGISTTQMIQKIAGTLGDKNERLD